jgi:hypothetical protein
VEPVALGVNVTEQEPPDRLQVVELKLPAAPVFENVTVPVGVMGVPVDVSVAVAVQVDAWLTTTGVVHERAVEVFLALTVIEVVPELVV